jgi:hypothetical protein
MRKGKSTIRAEVRVSKGGEGSCAENFRIKSRTLMDQQTIPVYVTDNILYALDAQDAAEGLRFAT